EVWHPVGPNDVFPEEFETFLLTDPAARADFRRVNSDLLDAAWWQQVQHRAGGSPPEVLSYPESMRFSHACAERPAEAAPPVGAPDAPPGR
ncbi:MAG: isocitrate dehydrogenase kinase/phosphatase-domain containing protein, partial [Casimicrobiaceae bacterium]